MTPLTLNRMGKGKKIVLFGRRKGEKNITFWWAKFPNKEM